MNSGSWRGDGFLLSRGLNEIFIDRTICVRETRTFIQRIALLLSLQSNRSLGQSAMDTADITSFVITSSFTYTYYYYYIIIFYIPRPSITTRRCVLPRALWFASKKSAARAGERYERVPERLEEESTRYFLDTRVTREYNIRVRPKGKKTR